jgi:hypothetical protein
VKRRCGGCSLCCKLLPVRELAKPANTKCDHQSSKGCGIYRKLGFPLSCGLWSCRWLIGKDTADMQRPDRTGYVIDMMPDAVIARNDETGESINIIVIQVWVDGSFKRALEDRALWRYAERMGEDNKALILRNGSSDAVTMFPPSMASDHKWHVIGGDQMTVKKTGGNMLLEMARRARRDANLEPV